MSAADGVAAHSQSVTVETLRQHWLRVMECDHATGRDKPHCACSRVDLGWHPSVGAAVEAWLAHVSGVAVGQPPNTCKLTECQGKPRCKTCLVMDGAYPARVPSLTDAQAEALIEASDGHWKEDLFCIGGPELMSLLRAACGVMASDASLAEGFDGSAVQAGPNHSTIEIWYDTEDQARAAHKVFRDLIDGATAIPCCPSGEPHDFSCPNGVGVGHEQTVSQQTPMGGQDGKA